ncbi:hypothetical protein AB0M20_35365 [Actinoplanes sp. NPDC051633]|uniref:hypothetical protein n=1 Tax=Actinoplanes sp. NPDC051633 TaxID=3155670 RepID=UPI003447DF3A
MPPRVAQPHAQALLDRVVRAPATRPAAPARTRRLRLVTVGVLAALIGLAALALPRLGGGPAYASWSSTAKPVPATDRADLLARCGAVVRDDYQAEGPARMLLAEQRGHYVAVSVGTDAWTATCFRDRDGSVLNPSFLHEPVNRRRLGGTGVELQGWPEVRTAEGYCRLMAGHVGSDVVTVDIIVHRTSEPRTVRATVGDGYFLAWYPAVTGGESVRTTLTLRLAGGGTVDGLAAGDLMNGPVLD